MDDVENVISITDYSSDNVENSFANIENCSADVENCSANIVYRLDKMKGSIANLPDFLYY